MIHFVVLTDFDDFFSMIMLQLRILREHHKRNHMLPITQNMPKGMMPFFSHGVDNDVTHLSSLKLKFAAFNVPEHIW